MALYPIEIFAKITYDDELTFEELQDIEEKLLSEIRSYLSEMNAEHIDFHSVADGIQVHFSLKNSSLKPIKKACKGLQAMLQNHVGMKLTVINRELTGLYLCSITHKSFDDKVVRLF